MGQTIGFCGLPFAGLVLHFTSPLPYSNAG
jgi:hypothetical protein